MFTVISGYGPRVGSSHIMRQAKVRGYEIHGEKYFPHTPVSGNPGGYYDMYDKDIPLLRSGIAKIWPRQLRLLRTVPSKIVVLGRRDMDAWLASIDKQIKREGGGDTLTAEQVLEHSYPLMDLCLEGFPGEVLKVCTEDLDDRLEEIFQFIGE